MFVQTFSLLSKKVNRVRDITKRFVTPTPALRKRLEGIVETDNYPIVETDKGIIKKKDNKEDNKHIVDKSFQVIKDRERYL
tara:strand:- start:990 stop:1232 length:243 start_codon:yes stop_codon:yes gene_type:complete